VSALLEAWVRESQTSARSSGDFRQHVFGIGSADFNGSARFGIRAMRSISAGMSNVRSPGEEVTFDRCWECNVSRTRFCDRCHEVVNLEPDCFDCHYYPE